MGRALDAAAEAVFFGQRLSDVDAMVKRSSDRWSEAAGVRLLVDGRRAACPGCGLGHCCYQPVLTTFVEALAVARALTAAGRATRSFRRALRRAGEKQERTLLVGRESERMSRCPLLDRQNRCTVYAVRPTSCRTYIVFDGRDACRPYAEREDGERPMVAVVDNGAPVATSIQVAMTAAAGLGWPRDIYVRGLPLQVAAWLDADVGPADDFWETIRRQSAIDHVSLAKIAANQAGSVIGFDSRGILDIIRQFAESVEAP
jgi:Fe-S-cluster containining protein